MTRVIANQKADAKGLIVKAERLGKAGEDSV